LSKDEEDIKVISLEVRREIEDERIKLRELENEIKEKEAIIKI
jgi:hypothetical protein